jgi:inner membrane protein
MDSLTHIVTGACIGELFLGKKIGRKAMLYGAVVASLPDIDFIASFWLSTTDDLLAHRGFTHSLLFGLGVVAGCSFFLRRRHSADGVPAGTWLIFLGTAFGSHLFLDVFNAYGIGWFEPFSHYRVSFNTIFVADPFFSIWPALASVFLLVSRNSGKRRRWAGLGLICCSGYLIYCIANKHKIDNNTRYAFLHQDIQYGRYFTTPTPFNNWLWYIVAESDSGYYIGYRSVFDRSDKMAFRYFSRNDDLLRPFNARKDLQELIRFSKGYFTAEKSDRGIVFNDLRFGQMMGWQNPDAHFVFHYYLQEPDANQFVVQRGRFVNWNWATVKALMWRIRGN